MVELEDLEVDHHYVECLVADVLGSVASLLHAEGLGSRLSDRLSAGAPGYLVFADHGVEVGLRGVVAAAPGRDSMIEFVVVDRVQERERRKGRRVPFVTRARLIPTDTSKAGDEQEAIETFTLDLSVSGALLRARPQFAEHERYSVELFFAADPRPVRCEAVRARQAVEGIALEFEHLDESDQARLAEAVAAHCDAFRQRGPHSTPIRGFRVAHVSRAPPAALDADGRTGIGDRADASNVDPPF